MNQSQPHRATPEQWQKIEEFVKDCGYDSCLLELRARVEALEAANQSWNKKVNKLAGVAKDVSSNLAAMSELRAASAESRPGGLVERVGRAIDAAPYDEDLHQWDEARAAIRAVAAWLRTGRLLNAAELLEQEADRG